MSPKPYPPTPNPPKPFSRLDLQLAVNRLLNAAAAGDVESRQLLQFVLLRADEIRGILEAQRRKEAASADLFGQPPTRI